MNSGQVNCNICGRFIWPTGPGVSWSQNYTQYDLHDPTYRCSGCTDIYGIAKSNCNQDSGPWSGRNPLLPPATCRGARE